MASENGMSVLSGFSPVQSHHDDPTLCYPLLWLKPSTFCNHDLIQKIGLPFASALFGASALEPLLVDWLAFSPVCEDWTGAPRDVALELTRAGGPRAIGWPVPSEAWVPAASLWGLGRRCLASRGWEHKAAILRTC